MPKIKIYSTPTCSYCHKLKDFLKENKIEFEDINVAVNPAKAKEMVDKSGQMGVPVADIDGKFIVGFGAGEKEKIKSLLGIK